MRRLVLAAISLTLALPLAGCSGGKSATYTCEEWASFTREKRLELSAKSWEVTSGNRSAAEVADWYEHYCELDPDQQQVPDKITINEVEPK